MEMESHYSEPIAEVADGKFVDYDSAADLDYPVTINYDQDWESIKQNMWV